MNISNENFVDSSAMACLILYKTNGLHGAIDGLLNIIEKDIAISRINLILVSHNNRRVLHIYDTDKTYSFDTISLNDKEGVAIILSEKKDEAVYMNNLDSFKHEPSFAIPELAHIPFWKHNSLLRVPLLKTESDTLLINFWSNKYNIFTDDILHKLEKILSPLSNEIRDVFFLTEKHNYTNFTVSSGEDKLKLCPELNDIYENIKIVAPTLSTVLIMGETGTGKEAVADSIYELSNRRDKPFLKINCGAMAPGLLTSELFGHERGAFTGAVSSRKGYFEQASGGTLFLDEIGEMPLEAQIHLLRVIEKKYITHVGDHKAIPIDVRIIAATQDDLMQKVKQGKFRKDLWFRLSVFPILLKPLRERKADIPYLVNHFLRLKMKTLNINTPVNITQEEMSRLYNYNWPGNVRELEFVIERSLILSKKNSLRSKFKFHFMPLENTNEDFMEKEWPTLLEYEYRYIKKVLDKTGYKLTGQNSASEILNINYMTLRSRMKEMGLLMPRQKK
ncbi:MAG: sigma-54 interaction domain-containing protein [Desulfovibrio piger]|uniref:sigma-54 interaction domain-containing protein n=1 Tax=Desulfovibrio piger TaxID=901 RepID=UPI0039998EFE